MHMIKGRVIWEGLQTGDPSMGIELTNLIRFNGAWYCGFREGVIHHNHPSGRARIIRSVDRRHWETVHIFDWEGADVREPKLSVTAEGWLMASTSLYFTSPYPREAGEPGAALHDAPSALNLERRLCGRFYQLDGPGTPEGDDETRVARQSVTWLSRDGVQWSSAWACPSGINTWRWGVCWHGGMGYSVGYCGKDALGTLYRTRDGKHWRVLKAEFFPEGGGSEASLAFAEDATAWCFLRHGPARMMLGRGTPPDYREWT